MKTRGRHFGRLEGQAGLFVVLNLGLLLGAIGLAVDVGLAYFTKMQAQSAADAAALAAASYATHASSGSVTCGSSGVTCGTTKTCDSSVTSATDTFSDGCLYAASNGFVNNAANHVRVTMTGNSGSAQAPPGVSGNTPTYWVQANISTSPVNLFGPFGGLSRFTINASSIAAVTSYTPGACVFALDPSAAAAFTATGSAIVDATSCGIFVNSSANGNSASTAAFVLTGSAKVTASGAKIAVNGTAYFGGTSSASPTPTTGAGSFSDPLSGQAVPTFTQTQANNCGSNNAVSIGSTTHTTIYSTNSYCGGLSIGNSAVVTFDTTAGPYIINNGLTIGGSAQVTFNPGVYIINGSNGGTALSFGNSAKISGSGVTFFITGQYKDSSNHNYVIGNVQMTGATTVTLSAPSSGTYQGMLFLQDRNLSYTTANSFANSSSSVLQGTLYFPTSPISYSGATTSGTYTAVIGQTVSIGGSADFLNDPTGAYTGLASTVQGIIQ
jgi:hypothetical protein